MADEIEITSQNVYYKHVYIFLTLEFHVSLTQL